MARPRSKFAKVACVVRKRKAIVRAISPPAKRARLTGEVIMLPPPPTKPAVEESVHLQPESSALGASTFAPVFELPTAIPTLSKPALASVEVKSCGLRASSV